MITGPEPGLTRDAVASRLFDAVGEIEIVDTAGLRKKARVEASLEKMSVSASIEALKMAEVVVLCTDAVLGLHEQDLQIGRLIEREGRACVLVLNKWDAVEDRGAAMRGVTDRLQTSMAQMKGLPIVTLSAMTGAGVEKLLPAVRRVHEIWNTRVGTGELNRWVRGRARASSAAAGRRPAAEAALHHPAEGPATDLPRLRHAGRADAGRLPALPGERPARPLQAARRADPPAAARHEEPLRRRRLTGTSAPMLRSRCTARSSGLDTSTPSPLTARQARNIGAGFIVLGALMLLIAAACFALLFAYVPEDMSTLIVLALATVGVLGVLTISNGAYMRRVGRQNRVLRSVSLVLFLFFLGCLIALNRQHAGPD